MLSNRRVWSAWRSCCAGALLLACAVDSRDVGIGSETTPAGAGGNAGAGSGPNCGTGQGGCADVPAPAIGDCDPGLGATQCLAAERAQACAADGQWGEVIVCVAATPVCRDDLDGSCGCVEHQRRCVAGAPEVCTGGRWIGAAACEAPLGHCLATTGSCVSCEPGAETCQEQTPIRCNAQGSWDSLSGCAGEMVNCGGCAPGEPCTLGTDCSGGVCVQSTDTCGCDAESCGGGQVCSLETGECEAGIGDCPRAVPQVFGDTDLAFQSVRFNPNGSAEVVIQNVGSGSITYAPLGYRLCNGSANCVFLSEEGPVAVNLGQSFSLTLPNTVSSGGELAVLLQLDGEVYSDAYVAWGTGALSGSLEVAANASVPHWPIGQRITIDPGDTGFVCTGPTNAVSSYTSCNP